MSFVYKGAYLVGGELETSPRATAVRVTFLVITTKAPSKGKTLPPTRYAPVYNIGESFSGNLFLLQRI